MSDSFKTSLNVLYGLGMSTGLILTGMNRPSQTWSFFNLRRWREGNQDFTLGIIFPIALVTHYFIWQVSKRRGKPCYSKEFKLPTNTSIDKDLVLGASLFGIGWAIGGYCPGPAVVAAFSGQVEPILVSISMFVGWTISHVIKKKKNESKKSISNIIATSISIPSFLGVASTFAAIHMLNPHQIIEQSPKEPWSLSLTPIIGGLFLGSSIGAAIYFTGQILGLSGMLSGVILKKEEGDKKSNVALFLGLGIGALLFRFINPAMNLTFFDAIPMWRFCLGGLIAGIGTGYANGCTSGHGICGMSRLSSRSILATCLFMLSSIATSTIFNF